MHRSNPEVGKSKPVRVSTSIRRSRLAASVICASLLLAACNSSAPPSSGPPQTFSSPASPGSGSLGPGGKFPLGTLEVLSGQGCSGGASCDVEFQVTCPDVQNAAKGTFLIQSPSVTTRGIVVFFLGGLGTGEAGESINREMVLSLADHGIESVIVKWVDSWLESAPGEEVGPARLACRPATAVAWIHENYYRAMGAPSQGLGGCGFCITGNSGGSSQSAYALSFYGLGSIVDAAILSGGPPHAAIEQGCTGQAPYTYTPVEAPKLDYSYGFLNGGGPCEQHDSSFSTKWKQDSLESGGGVYKLPKTRILFIFGSADPTTGPVHGMAYLDKLQAAGSPYVSEETIPGMPHTIEIYPAGRDALENALLAKV